MTDTISAAAVRTLVMLPPAAAGAVCMCSTGHFKGGAVIKGFERIPM